MWYVWPCISTGKQREAIEGRESSKCPYRNSPVSDSRCRLTTCVKYVSAEHLKEWGRIGCNRIPLVSGIG